LDSHNFGSCILELDNFIVADFKAGELEQEIKVREILVCAIPHYSLFFVNLESESIRNPWLFVSHCLWSPFALCCLISRPHATILFVVGIQPKLVVDSAVLGSSFHYIKIRVMPEACTLTQAMNR
jgi:hypothetical protein